MSDRYKCGSLHVATLAKRTLMWLHFIGHKKCYTTRTRKGLKMAKQFTQEFRESAIQLVVTSKASTSKVSRDLGMPARTLQGWVQEYRSDKNLQVDTRGNVTKKAAALSLEEENKRLKKENASLKKDAEILKKAAAYFARETL